MKVRTTKRKIKLTKHFFKIQSREHEDSVEENLASITHYNYKKIKKIKTPIHLIYGEKDIIVTKGQTLKFHELIPQATLESIPNAGHLAPIETPQSMATLIANY